MKYIYVQLCCIPEISLFIYLLKTPFHERILNRMKKINKLAYMLDWVRLGQMI